MDGSNYNQGRCHWIANSGCPAYSPLEGSGGKNKKALKSLSATDNYAQSHEECTILDEGTTKPSADGKKRKACDDWSRFAQLKNPGTEEEKKPVATMCCEIAGREVRDSSTSGNSPKKDSVRVRAKRGQATNSHSLAERVRREKIRERMKFLQDLVPGCSKITGKAIMLDEIINYVLSLQRQVEFLSMKLATFCPEADVEREEILSRDASGSAAMLGDPNKKLLSRRNSARSLAGYPDLKP